MQNFIFFLWLEILARFLPWPHRKWNAVQSKTKFFEIMLTF